jgi:lysophospholipase L1-like esterase
MGSDRIQNPYLYHVPTDTRISLGLFRSPPAYHDAWRCDTHPRFSRDGSLVVIDSPDARYGRQLHLIEIGSIVRSNTKDSTMPRVLVIGDSISMGYMAPLHKLLANKADVVHPPENCRSSRQIVQRLDQYLGHERWDVIQFNCGIHDLTYLNEQAEVASAAQGGKIQVPLDEYRANLEKIVARLKQTNAVLIWCTTTPLRGSIGFRIVEDVDHYNAVAKDIMLQHNIRITDLHELTLRRRLPKWSPDGVHFTDDGYRELAADIAPAIEQALTESRK